MSKLTSQWSSKAFEVLYPVQNCTTKTFKRISVSVTKTSRKSQPLLIQPQNDTRWQVIALALWSRCYQVTTIGKLLVFLRQALQSSTRQGAAMLCSGVVEGGNYSPLNFSLWEDFLHGIKFSSKNTKFGAENPPLWLIDWLILFNTKNSDGHKGRILGNFAAKLNFWPPIISCTLSVRKLQLPAVPTFLTHDADDVLQLGR